MEPIDLKYISQISSYLRNFKRKSDKLFNFSCWYCGDSEKNPRRARGFLYEKDRACLYHCHNCAKATNLKQFLKDIDYNLYKEYLKETLSKEDIKISKDLLKPVQIVDQNIFNGYLTIDQLKNNHFAKEYLKKRKIPNKYFSNMYFVPAFKKFTNNLLPGKFEKYNYSDPRIVIPFISSNGDIFGYQGRALYDSNAKYITIILNDSYSKIWNLNKVNLNKRFYVTEGIFDAMFLENSVAVCGSELSHGIDSLHIDRSNAVLILDNEPRNKDVLRQYRRAIKAGYKVFIWPEDLEKDINECVLKGYTGAELQNIIDENSYTGLTAELKFNEWSKYES